MRNITQLNIVLLAGCITLAGLAPIASPALAQKPPDAAAKAEAERAGKEGERLLAQHEAGRAVEYLQRAFRLSGGVKFLLPLGMAYAEAERPLDALDALGRFLKETPALPDAKRREIGGKLQVMLDQVAAVVTVEASRENAAVKVDGRPIGTTPIEAPLRLMPGKHEIVMQAAATDPSSGARVVVEVRPGERRAVKLEPGPRSRFLEPQSDNTGTADTDDESEPARKPAKARRAVAAAPRDEAPSDGAKPIYKKWWFWTAIGGGAAAVVVIGLAAGLGSRGGSSGNGEMIAKAPDWSGGPIDARGSALLTLGGAL